MLNLRECAIEDLDPRVITETRKFIPKDEKVLICLEWTRRTFFGGLDMYGVDIITEKQLFHANLYVDKDGRIGASSTPFQGFETVRRDVDSNDLIGYEVYFDSRGFTFINRKDVADHFADALEQGIAGARERKFKLPLSISSSSDRIADQLIKLIELRNNNLLTEDEFNAAKRKLLE